MTSTCLFVRYFIVRHKLKVIEKTANMKVRIAAKMLFDFLSSPSSLSCGGIDEEGVAVVLCALLFSIFVGRIVIVVGFVMIVVDVTVAVVGFVIVVVGFFVVVDVTIAVVGFVIVVGFFVDVSIVSSQITLLLLSLKSM